jgi:hypothetical protein
MLERRAQHTEERQFLALLKAQSARQAELARRGRRTTTSPLGRKLLQYGGTSVSPQKLHEFRVPLVEQRGQPFSGRSKLVSDEANNCHQNVVLRCIERSESQEHPMRSHHLQLLMSSHQELRVAGMSKSLLSSAVICMLQTLMNASRASLLPSRRGLAPTS